MKVLLQTSAEHKFGQKNVLPVVGEVTYCPLGTVEVEITNAEDLILLLEAVADLNVRDGETLYTVSDLKAQLVEFKEDSGNDIVDEVTDIPPVVDNIAAQTFEDDLGKGKELTDALTAEPVTSTPLVAGEAEKAVDDVSDAAPVVNADVISEKIETGTELNDAEKEVEKQAFILTFQKKDLTALKELAKIGEYPDAEWTGFTTKKDMIQYLTDKLNGK